MQDTEGGDTDRVSPSSAADGPEDGTSPSPSERPSATRERLLRATIDVVSTVGYDALVSDQIVEVSRLSRTVLYRRLGGRRAAVLAAARQVLDDLARTVHTALAAYDERDRVTEGAPTSTSRAVVGLTALTQALAADPPAAAVLFLEAPAAGHEARPLRADLLTLVAEILDARGAHDPADTPTSLPGITVDGGYSHAMRAGALHHVLHRRIACGDAAELPTVVPDVLRALSSLPR